MTITAETKIVGIIGNPVSHSMSPVIHNACFSALSLSYVYAAFEVKDIAGAIRGLRALGIRGVSVTIPHKVASMRYIDKIDPLAEKIGAINTIVNDNGTLSGYNTDAHGVQQSFSQKRVALKHRRALILGSGGAARAVAFILAESAVERINIASIEKGQMDKLIGDLRRHYSIEIVGSPWNKARLKNIVKAADIVINATSVGMHPYLKSTPVNTNFLQKGQAVFDVIYNPEETRLLKGARKKGCRIVSGTDMFINQAAEQFRLFTGRTAPINVMKKAFAKAMKK